MTYTPREICGRCGLEVQKVMVAKEGHASGVWDCVGVVVDVATVSPRELAERVATIIESGGGIGTWCIQIFVWKHGVIDLAPPIVIQCEDDS